MRAADASEGGAGQEIGVPVGAEDHGAGVLVKGVGFVEEAEEGKREEGGDVGVVHEEVGVVAVCFVGEDLAEGGVVHDCVVEDAVADGCAVGFEDSDVDVQVPDVSFVGCGCGEGAEK